MKKLIKYFLIIVIIVIAMPSKNTGIEDLIKQYNIPNIKNTYYTTQYKEIKNAKVIQCGSAVFVESDIMDCESIKKQLKNINGQSVTFLGNQQLYNKLINNLFNNIMLSESVSGVKCCYGYNNKLNNNIIIDGNKVNIQIAINNNVITIGTPVILGSY